MTEKALTVAEVSDRLCLSQQTIRRYLKTGKLKGFKRGITMWGVKLRDVESYERRNEK